MHVLYWRGVNLVGPPPLSKILKDYGGGYIYMYIIANAHIFRSILRLQLFTCLSLAILFLLWRLCSVALTFIRD